MCEASDGWATKAVFIRCPLDTPEAGDLQRFWIFLGERACRKIFTHPLQLIPATIQSATRVGDGNELKRVNAIQRCGEVLLPAGFKTAKKS
jgi:hypothetical protein